MDMSPRITTPDHTRRLRGITLTILLALLISGCDKADRSDGQPSEDTVNVDRDITAASTPLAVTATAVNTADTLPQGTFDIRLSEGKFTIVANDAPARDILDDLAVLAGFVVVDSGIPLERVTLAIENSDLHAALVELLQPHPYQTSYEFDTSRSTYALTRILLGHTATAQEMTPAQPRQPVAGNVTVNPEGAPLPGTDSTLLSAEDQAYLTLLLDPLPEVRADAAENIEATGVALDYLAIIITSDPSPEVRMAATYSLENSDDPRAVDTLIMGLDDTDPEVLVEVIDSLDFLDDRSAIPYLQPLLDHPDEDVRDAAESAIESLQ